MHSNLAYAFRLVARVEHAASVGSDLYNMAGSGSRNQSRHHGRQTTPRKRDHNRRVARANKQAVNPFIVSDTWIDPMDSMYGDWLEYA